MPAPAPAPAPEPPRGDTTFTIPEEQPASGQPPLIAVASAADEAKDQLESMPAEGPTSLLGGLGYLLTVTRARRQRNAVIRAFEREIIEQRRGLELVQAELGKKAWELDLKHHTIRGTMEALRSLHGQRDEVDRELSLLDGRDQQAQEQYSEVEQQCSGRMGAAQQEVNTHQAALNERNAQHQVIKNRQTHEERALQGLQGQLRAKEVAATKQPDQAAMLGQEIAALTPQVQEMESRRQGTAAEAEALMGPIAELTAQLAEAQGQVDAAAKELNGARQALTRARQQVTAERKTRQQERSRLEGDITRRCFELGKTVDNERVQSDDLKPIYDQANSHHDGIREREKSIQLLQAECQMYNRKGYQNGISIIVGAVGLVLLLAITGAALLVVLSG